MPSIIKICVTEARDLPPMDKKTKLADPYVEIKFGDFPKQKTHVALKTLHPVWKEDFRIHVHDDIALQDLPLEFKVWDRDIYSANDTIGSVTLDLNSLLGPGSPEQDITGWFPIFDTIHGIRGELHLSVRLSFFGDVNPFKDSAAGVHFYSASVVSGFAIVRILGFVEELVVEDDPEYHWVDSFRTNRSSNEERQLLLQTLGSRIRRNVGRKALRLHGNAVLGYHAHFDFEEERGIIARGIGTAVELVREGMSSFALPPFLAIPILPLDTAHSWDTPPNQHQSFTASVRAGDVELLTLTTFDDRVMLRVGGLVSTRAVKRLQSRDAELGVRDQWWQEVRDEVRSHARALQCPYVVGYTETTSIFEDVCVLSACGTAAVLWAANAVVPSHTTSAFPLQHTRHRSLASVDGSRVPSEMSSSQSAENIGSEDAAPMSPHNADTKTDPLCSSTHTPYSRSQFPMALSRCQLCGHHLVPEVLLATVQPQSLWRFPVVGCGQLVEARACHPKLGCSTSHDEEASHVSERLPFLEYDLHSQLLRKLRWLGMNAAFGVQLQVTVGQKFICALATATAVNLASLPPAPPLRIERAPALAAKSKGALVGEESERDLLVARVLRLNEQNRRVCEKQRVAWNETRKQMKRQTTKELSSPVRCATGPLSSADALQWKPTTPPLSQRFHPPLSRPMSLNTAPSLQLVPFQALAQTETDRTTHADLEMEPRETLCVRVDDEEDLELLSLLLESRPFPGIPIHCSNTEVPPGWNLEWVWAPTARLRGAFVKSQQDGAFPSPPCVSCAQTLCLVRRVPWNKPCRNALNAELTAVMLEMYALLSFKARMHAPCFLSALHVQLDLPPDALNVTITCAVIKLEHPTCSVGWLRRCAEEGEEKKRSEHKEVPEEEEVDEKEEEPALEYLGVSPLAHVPHARTVRYVGHISLHLIKETEIRDGVGFGAFTQMFLSEVLSVAHAQVLARGGNALLSYKLESCTVMQVTKTRAYGLISMSGDAALVEKTPLCHKNNGLKDMPLQQ